MKPVSAKTKCDVVVPVYRIGTATLPSGRIVHNVKRRLVFNEYEYYLNNKEIEVSAFSVEEYIDETGQGRDNQTK